MMKKKGPAAKSIKDGGGLHKSKGVSKSENLGHLMRRYRMVEDVLFTHVVNSDFVYEDMDFTIEEFSDMTGADLDELMEEINAAVRASA